MDITDLIIFFFLLGIVVTVLYISSRISSDLDEPLE